MNLLLPLKQWIWSVNLNLTLAEISDTEREIREAQQEQQFGTVRALESYLRTLTREVEALRRKLGMPE